MPYFSVNFYLNHMHYIRGFLCVCACATFLVSIHMFFTIFVANFICCNGSSLFCDLDPGITRIANPGRIAIYSAILVLKDQAIPVFQHQMISDHIDLFGNFFWLRFCNFQASENRYSIKTLGSVVSIV